MAHMAAKPAGSHRASAAIPASSAASEARRSPASMLEGGDAPSTVPAMTAPARLRFAPSPNGYLHLGHAYSALMNARIAEHLGGTLLLRFEDIDTVRCRPEYMEAALEDLAWLGLRWQEPVWRQSERFPVYAAALERLKAEGLVYPCFCSRGDIARAIAGRPDWPRDPDGSPVYPGTCRHFSNAERSERTAAGSPVAYNPCPNV